MSQRGSVYAKPLKKTGNQRGLKQKTERKKREKVKNVKSLAGQLKQKRTKIIRPKAKKKKSKNSEGGRWEDQRTWGGRAQEERISV